MDGSKRGMGRGGLIAFWIWCIFFGVGLTGVLVVPSILMGVALIIIAVLTLIGF